MLAKRSVLVRHIGRPEQIGLKLTSCGETNTLLLFREVSYAPRRRASLPAYDDEVSRASLNAVVYPHELRGPALARVRCTRENSEDTHHRFALAIALHCNRSDKLLYRLSSSRSAGR